MITVHWHPVSELPKEDGTYDCLGGTIPFRATYKNGKWIDFQYNWQNKIRWWRSPPKKN